MIEELQKELEKTFRKAESQRKMLRITQITCYGVSLLYFVFILFVQFSGAAGFMVHDYETNPNPTFWEANPLLKFIIPVFVLIYISGALLPQFFSRFSKLEQASVQQIMSRLFPEVRCTLGDVSVSKSFLINSSLFPELFSGESSVTTFGSLEFSDKDNDLTVYDLAVIGEKKRNFLTSNAIADYVRLFMQVFKLTVSSRLDSGMCAFRGMFTSARLPKAVNGTVIILPDKLTERLDYLAPVIQSMKKVAGSTLVKLEDPEFERRFAVYATDEVLARYVLTPLMMQQMTDLHKKYNRDIMLSFHTDVFYFAVPMREGLLTLGDKSVAKGNSIQAIHDNVLVAQSILKDLRLK